MLPLTFLSHSSALNDGLYSEDLLVLSRCGLQVTLNIYCYDFRESGWWKHFNLTFQSVAWIVVSATLT